MSADENRLQSYVDTWARAVDDSVELLRSLDDEDWSRPTDLPGWDVRAVAAHLAHLESELAGNPQQPVEVPEAPHVTSPMSTYTEKGPIARSGWTTREIVEELVASSARRLAELRADPPTDGAGSPPTTPGNIGWSWQTLLSNRPLDVWMHEQDIRRAVGRPGGLDSPAAAHTAAVFARGLGYVVGKRVGAPAGTSVVLDVTGPHPVHAAVAGRRGRPRGPPRRGPRRADGDAAHRPRVLRRAVRRAPPARRRGRHGRGGRRPRAAGARRDGRHAVTHGRWTPEDIPDLTGRRAVVTGATSGLGEAVVAALARHGAEVVLAARDPARLAGTAALLRREAPQATVHQLLVDLADLSSVRRAAAEASAYGPVHLLVNNAGVMATPYHRTADGFELQMATNVLGHFALTGLLLAQLVAAGEAGHGDTRVVSVSSQAHRLARTAPLGDPRVQVADLPPVAGLRAVQAGEPAVHVRARPPGPRGGAAGERGRRAPGPRGEGADDLRAHGFGAHGSVSGRRAQPAGSILDATFALLGQPPALGALPLLMAATADLPGAAYVGPGGPGEVRGLPEIVGASRLARDPEVARRWWQIAQEATGVVYP